MQATECSAVVIGLGYVGLPLAVALAKHGGATVGFDVDQGRVAELRDGRDRTHEVDSATLAASPLVLTDDPAQVPPSDFYIVTVPTPIDSARRPDLGPLVKASETIGKALKHGDVVVYEPLLYTPKVILPFGSM